MVGGVLTALCYLADVHSLFCSHEAQHGKHHKASKETGPTVDKSQHKCIPIESEREREIEREREREREREIM